MLSSLKLVSAPSLTHFPCTERAPLSAPPPSRGEPAEEPVEGRPSPWSSATCVLSCSPPASGERWLDERDILLT